MNVKMLAIVAMLVSFGAGSTVFAAGEFQKPEKIEKVEKLFDIDGALFDFAPCKAENVEWAINVAQHQDRRGDVAGFELSAPDSRRRDQRCGKQAGGQPSGRPAADDAHRFDHSRHRRLSACPQS